MTTIPTTLFTASEFWDFVHRPENRDRIFELERGKVVELSRPGELHGVVCINAGFVLSTYIRQRSRGYACCNDTGVIWESDPDTVKGPDLFFYDKNRTFGELHPKWTEALPTLVIEVLSPNDQLTKMNRRISRFMKWGVPLIWLIDPEEQTVTIYRPDRAPEVLEKEAELTGDGILPDFHCRVSEFFYMPDEAGEATPPAPSSPPSRQQKRAKKNGNSHRKE